MMLLRAELLLHLGDYSNAQESSKLHVPKDYTLHARRLAATITGLFLNDPTSGLVEAQAIVTEYEGDPSFGADHVETLIARRLVADLLDKVDDPKAMDSISDLVIDMERSLGHTHYETAAAQLALVIAMVKRAIDNEERQNTLQTIRTLAKDMNANPVCGQYNKLKLRDLESRLMGQLCDALTVLPIAKGVADEYEMLYPGHLEALEARKFVNDLLRQLSRI